MQKAVSKSLGECSRLDASPHGLTRHRQMEPGEISSQVDSELLLHKLCPGQQEKPHLFCEMAIWVHSRHSGSCLRSLWGKQDPLEDLTIVPMPAWVTGAISCHANWNYPGWSSRNYKVILDLAFGNFFFPGCKKPITIINKTLAFSSLSLFWDRVWTWLALYLQTRLVSNSQRSAHLCLRNAGIC